MRVFTPWVLMKKSYIFDCCHAEIIFSWQLEFLNALWLEGLMLVYVIESHNRGGISTALPFAFL